MVENYFVVIIKRKNKMKNVEVSVEMYDFLIQTSKNLKEQDNRATADPYVYQIRYYDKVYGEDLFQCDGTKWLSPDHIDALESINEVWDYLKENTDEEHELEEMKLYENNNQKEDYIIECGWKEIMFQKVEKVYQSFLTEESLKEHIRINDHNLPKDRFIYVDHCYRNNEMKMLVEFLKNLTF
jgi:hypothetical protein